MSREIRFSRIVGHTTRFALIALITLSALAHSLLAQERPAGSTATNSIRVVVIADQGVIQEVVEAAKGAGITGAPAKIPASVLKAVLLNRLLGRFGKWLQQVQICQCLDTWMAGKNVGATGMITVEFVLVASADESPTATTPSIAVPMFASKTGQGTATAGNSGGRGYLAPIQPGVGPVMKYDLFGDGSYVISALECPREKLR